MSLIMIEIKSECLTNIDNIFNNLQKEDLIDPESKFFRRSKKIVSNVCYYYLYPLEEFLNTSIDVNHDFFLYNSYLHAYIHFLDQSLDSLEGNFSTKVRSFQISAYCLTNYLEWLIDRYDQKFKVRFYEYYKEYSFYLITEKKWNFPQCYLSKYGLAKNIHKKAFMLLFPLELCKKNTVISKEVVTIKKLFIDYYSFALLADDLIDFDFDIKHCYLTYPIARYFNLKRELPNNQIELTSILPQMVKILRGFLKNINRLEKHIDKHSVIIDERISQIKNELIKKEIEL